MKDLSTTALISYPLSQDYKKILSGLVDADISYVLLSDLKRQGVWAMLRSLRAIKGRLLLPLEDPSSEALLPILRLLALCTHAKERIIIMPNYALRNTSLVASLKGLLGFCLASVANYWSYSQVRRELSRLDRITPRAANPIKNKLLYLNTNLWFGIKAGGSVGHIAGVCNALADKQYEVTYAAVENNPLLQPAIQHCPLTPLATYGLPYELNNYRFHRHLVKALTLRMQQDCPEFIYQRLSLANMSGVILAKRFGIPLVIEYNGSEAWIAKNWGRGLRYMKLAEQVEASCLQHAAFIVTISDVLKDELCQRGISPDKIIAYPNGIDAQRFDPEQYTQTVCLNLRQQHEIPASATVCTFLGTFGRWHGVDVLADALDELAQQEASWFANNQVYFLFVGDGLLLPQIKAQLLASAAGEYCRFVGLVPQVDAPQYLAASDILLSPHKPNDDGSRFFGSPTKLFEYMAMAKAIIASDLEQVGAVLQPGIKPEHIEAGTLSKHCNAVLCEPGNPKDIIIALRWLVNEPHWRETIGKNARQKVLGQYTWQHHVEQILKPMMESE